nr:vesicle-associated membrane protein 727 [Ipomoea batatas]
MNPKGLIYSFVAKGTVVLAEYTPYSGNFSTIAVQCLQKLPSSSSKYTYSCDGHTFNFLLDSGFVFLVVADESTGRNVPFVFLEKDRFSIAYNLDREFGPRLKEHMQYCMNHPDEISKLSKLKAQITEVKGIMMDNIEKVLDRGERIELLVDKTENLQFQADSFQRHGRQLRRKMWLQSLQMKLMVGGAVVAVIMIIWVIACGGLLHPPASSGTHQIDLIDVPSYPKLGQGFASQDPSKGKIAAALEEIDVEDLDLDENFEGPHHPTNRWSFPEHRAGYL